MSYEDRGNKKWIPFLMPEHKGLLKRYYQEVHHLKFEDTYTLYKKLKIH